MWRNVLITAGSRRVPLVQAFQQALRAGGGGHVVVTDINPLSPTVYVADRACRVPLSSDPGYLDAVLDICRTERVGLVIPTIDEELSVFARGVERFASEGIRVVVSPPATADACFDKVETSRVLQAHGVAAADTCTPATLPAAPAFPLFIKPRFGRGSVGAFRVRNARELAFFRDYVQDPVVQTYLDGPEFTIDVLCDFDGSPLAVVPRERVVVRAGVVDRARTVRDPRLIELGLACANAMAFVGAVNIQCRIVGGTPVVFEINPRFSGGIPLTIAAGADFPRVIVDLARDRPVAPFVGHFLDGLWMTNYESSVFVSASAVSFSRPALRTRIPEVA
ncbi:MAG: ATP-grasp domain-containing protein [Vicinamibacterales bacterium]